MPALEPVASWRVVATAGALDGARWQGESVEVLWIAPDEALGLGATGVEVDDPDAIVEPDAGISCARLSAAELQDVLKYVEWHVPAAGGGDEVAQGKVGGTPAKLVLREALLVVQTCYVEDLRSRLGW